MDNSNNWSKRLPTWIPGLVFLVLGAGITVWTLAEKIPDNWLPFLCASFGLIIAGFGVISFLLRHELSIFTKDIVARMDWLWSFDSNVSWKLATQIVDTTALQNGLECYETSSIPNPDRYEKSVLNLAISWRQMAEDKKPVFTRIFCFDDRSRYTQDNKLRQLFHQILDPEQDKEGQYTKTRECIRMGRMRVVHYPHRLLTDYLIVRTDKNDYDCLMSIAPPAKRNFLASARIRDREAGGRLLQHVEHIMALAVDHCITNATGQNFSCACAHYQFDQQTRTLIPR